MDPVPVPLVNKTTRKMAREFCNAIKVGMFLSGELDVPVLMFLSY